MPAYLWSSLAAARRMMDKALINIYTLQGKFARERR